MTTISVADQVFSLEPSQAIRNGIQSRLLGVSSNKATSVPVFNASEHSYIAGSAVFEKRNCARDPYKNELNRDNFLQNCQYAHEFQFNKDGGCTSESLLLPMSLASAGAWFKS